MRLLLWAAGPALNHIFLCSTMRARFSATYSIEPRSCIISNSAFVEVGAGTRIPTGQLTVGLLSNLTREKGLHTFLELSHRLHAERVPAKLILAGPTINEHDRNLVNKACQTLGEMLEYRGPLYDRMKEQFYEEIDVFLFPTEYQHEAEPTVLFEALSAGALVIAFNRGCIATQIGMNGLLIPTGDDFVRHSLKYLQAATLLLPETRAERKKRIASYAQLHETSLRSLTTLFSHSA
ncbi:glycosyltransferase [Bradyrhizobium centrosematis]|uniref:glycosyltransferase n=1 Tax=Bradyrhizobium centrosematis TaxID=1300039 RepID=UPI002168AF2E|nr:glycosyltransferase [Bradyrhizobium centrosematis]MCS3765065.1 glycosyltransferase involved in cell wall biosynthesis [Bradyrhizobium centrosematis]MCS3777659.1 glycosyltransferase involved in cell wall biosynthesis [Bradyrhizobium centrosematis]